MGASKKQKMKGLKKSDYPNDLGLLPKTFVAARWSEYLWMVRPYTRFWFQVQWMLIKTPIRNMLGLFFTLKASRWGLFSRKDPLRGPKNKLPLQLTDRVREAIRLHHDLNKAIASGDKKWIQENTCKGLKDNVMNTISRREAANLPPAEWEISYKGLSSVPSWPLSTILIPPFFRSYKVVSDIAGAIPLGTDSMLRQVIVRIQSTQTYNLHDGNAKNVGTTGTTGSSVGTSGPQKKTLYEYVVIQQLIWEGKPEHWRVWGTIHPSTPDEIRAILTKDLAKESLGDRLRSALPGNMGMTL